MAPSTIGDSTVPDESLLSPPVVVVMGVSAAGKSTVAAALAEKLATPWRDADDLHSAANVTKMASGQPLEETDRWPWLVRVREELSSGALTGGIVVACSALRRDHRDLLRTASSRVVFVHLTGTATLLRSRAAARVEHFMPATLLDSQLAALEPLGDDEPGIRIDVSLSVEDIAHYAAQWVTEHGTGTPATLTTKSPYRIAIVGTGSIAEAHAAAVLALPGQAQLVAVADVDQGRAHEFADRFAVPTVYTDAETMLATEALDLVHICTPPQTHAPIALQALRAGVAALVEKPTAMSLQEMKELADAQSAHQVPVLTVFQHRFGAAAVRLRRLIEAGTLGRPLVATCDTLWYRDDEYFRAPWRGLWETEGGGPTMGHGIHQFDLLLSLLGPWTQVTALAARQARVTDTEDVSIAIARFENGALATIVNSVVSPRETSRIRIDFDHATVELEHLYGYTDTDWTFTPAPGHEHLTELWNGSSTGEPTSHVQQIEDIIRAFTEGREPGVSLEDAYRTMEFAAATYASAFRGTSISAGELMGDDPFVSSMNGGTTPWPPLKGRAA
jgi:carbohydrate kinase (thermoresistant glucokinase family)